jgi:hypothetical protein
VWVFWVDDTVLIWVFGGCACLATRPQISGPPANISSPPYELINSSAALSGLLTRLTNSQPYAGLQLQGMLLPVLALLSGPATNLTRPDSSSGLPRYTISQDTVITGQLGAQGYPPAADAPPGPRVCDTWEVTVPDMLTAGATNRTLGDPTCSVLNLLDATDVSGVFGWLVGCVGGSDGDAT